MVRVIGIAIVAEQNAVAGVNRVQVTRPRDGPFDRRRNQAEIVDEDRPAAVGKLDPRGAGFMEGEIGLRLGGGHDGSGQKEGEQAIHGGVD